MDHSGDYNMEKSNTDIKLIFHGPGGRKIDVRRAILQGKPTLGGIR